MFEISAAEQSVLDLVHQMGVARVRDIRTNKFHPETLRRLVQKGYLVRLGRGIYAPANFEPTAQHGLSLVAIRVPRSVVCLLSALQFHELTTQLPRRVWIAVPPKARNPRLDWPKLEVHRFSGKSFTDGWTEYQIENVPVKIFDLAKTVADCFKFRNTVGLDVAIEALRDCLREKRSTVDELIRYARICRVEQVMRPYMEALV